MQYNLSSLVQCSAQCAVLLQCQDCHWARPGGHRSLHSASLPLQTLQKLSNFQQQNFRSPQKLSNFSKRSTYGWSSRTCPISMDHQKDKMCSNSLFRKSLISNDDINNFKLWSHLSGVYIWRWLLMRDDTSCTLQRYHPRSGGLHSIWAPIMIHRWL